MPVSESEDFPDVLRLVGVFTNACDAAARRDEYRRTDVTKHFRVDPDRQAPRDPGDPAQRSPVHLAEEAARGVGAGLARE